MSHVTALKTEVTDLDALSAACRRVGLELVKGQTSYRWFGQSVGDTPLPKGFTEEDLGKCEHAIRVPGSDRAYEVGVVKRKDGGRGYQLLADFWRGGYGLETVAGENCSKLVQAYVIERIQRQVGRTHLVQQTGQLGGELRLTVTAR